MSELAERTVKVDPDVAYESGLCTRCEPTKPQPWDSGPLLWMLIGFGCLIFIIIGLMLAAIAMCINYNQHCPSPSSSMSSSSSSSC